MAAGLDAASLQQHKGSQPCSIMRMEEEEEEGKHCSHLHDTQPHKQPPSWGAPAPSPLPSGTYSCVAAWEHCSPWWHHPPVG